MRQSGNIKDLLATRGNRTALLLSCSLASFQQLSGINVILFYGESIFRISGSNFSSSLSTIIIGVIMLFSSAVAPPFARTFGIKKCLILSAIGMGVFQVMHLKSLTFQWKNNNWARSFPILNVFMWQQCRTSDKLTYLYMIVHSDKTHAILTYILFAFISRLWIILNLL